MPQRTKSVPLYCKHQASGQAFVTLCGRDFYLVPPRSLASRVEYDRLITEWLANGRQPIHGNESDPGISTNKLVLGSWRHAQPQYRTLRSHPDH